MSQITEVSKFTVTIGGKEKTFDTKVAALEALAKVELAAKAQAYVDARGLEGKDAKGKFNVVLDYLAYIAGSETAAPEADAETF